MATPDAELKHAPALFTAPRAPRRLGRIRSGLLVGAAAALYIAVLEHVALVPLASKLDRAVVQGPADRLIELLARQAADLPYSVDSEAQNEFHGFTALHATGMLFQSAAVASAAAVAGPSTIAIER